MGAWIEIILINVLTGIDKMSLLSWERGLKYIDTVTNDDETTVAPLVGAWIEIC